MSVKISNYRKVVFFTGAGMSAECGVPTYRGHGGIWGQYNYQDCACQEAFDRDPRAVWEFHEKRRAQAASPTRDIFSSQSGNGACRAFRW